jgi:hypothetical protein
MIQMCSEFLSSVRDQHLLLRLHERWLVLARATAVIPLHKRVVLVRFFNGPEFPSRLSKISQAHNMISVAIIDFLSMRITVQAVMAVAEHIRRVCPARQLSPKKSFSFRMSIVASLPGFDTTLTLTFPF